MTISTLDELVTAIEDGCLLALPPDYSGVAMAATGALIKRQVKDLRLYCVPVSTLQADLLIGAGCVASVEAAAITLGEFGLAPRFTEAVLNGALVMNDSTCPAIHAGLQATEKGVPFMPLRGLIGSDILSHRPDWRVIDNPFGDNDPIVLLPAIQPDIALFHAKWVDREGNVWIGRQRELVTMAHAAKMTLVTVESVYDGCFYDDETLVAGTLPALYVTAVAEVRQGAWPLAFAGEYALDKAQFADYARLAKSRQGFVEYLRRYIDAEPLAA